jgi:hypothetical protein
MEDRSEWKGTASQLLEELKIIAVKLGINVNEKAFPKTANSLSKRINQLKTNLEETGIKIIKREEGRQRIIHLQQVAKSIEDVVVVASQSQNDAQNNNNNDRNDKSGDLFDGIGGWGTKNSGNNANLSLHILSPNQEDNSGLNKVNNDNNDKDDENARLLEEANRVKEDGEVAVYKDTEGEERDIMDDLPF